MQGLVGGLLKSLTFSPSHGEPVKAVKQGSGLEVEGHVRLALDRPFWLQSGLQSTRMATGRSIKGLVK